MNDEAGVPRRAVAWVLVVTASLRLIHLYFAIRSPLTYQPGPDEAYYIAFGRDVASGTGGMQPMFGFMDPFYGYLVGAVLRLTGSLFPIYLLQIALDTGTAYGVYRIASALGRHRTGVVAASLYACTGTAIAYTAAILKPTCDVAFVTWWSVLLLRLVREPTPRQWLLFGAYCGFGVAIRSNLLLMTPLAVAVVFACSADARRRWLPGAAALVVGLAVPLAMLAARNHAISGNWSPLPTNGGVVLHQLYNEDNPQSRSGVPRFVGRYAAPFDIWRGYAHEAERRAGHALRPHEVSAYWQHEALGYLAAHPAQSMANGIRKLREFSAYPEVPNTRSYGDERRFSPVLSVLPLPFGWLFALGFPGLALWLRRDRRALALWAPVAMGLATIAVFFAEDRFRFDFIGPFILGSAYWLVALVDEFRARHIARLAGAVAISAALGAWTIVQAHQLIPPFPSDWQRITWGYIRSGRNGDAQRELDRVERATPDATGVHELRGFIALRNGQPEVAAAHLERALAQRPDVATTWQNYSLAAERLGDTRTALAAAQRAEVLDPTAEAAVRVGDLQAALGRVDDARASWRGALARSPSPATVADIRQRLTPMAAAQDDTLRHPTPSN
ncbi:glycosyltransferase family 39 protein [Cognatilysobacter terrigena]|uniref:glycosyltransferase family 39 protein n=1 Tax=Cognatilysobacter terrigena TaxID=2488749 RepID=UPI00105DC478|nr:glycosyltransferase family 39 protein [Lysobacter terrigena]